jgi:beta-glucosidase-like glycosyl hydrolase
MLFGASAQEKKPLFTEAFDKQHACRLLSAIGSGFTLFFYYDSVQLDSFRITLSVQNQPLQAVLEKAFAGTDVLFSIDAEQHVFVSRQLQVLTTLPAGFGDVPQKGKEVAQKAAAVVGDERRQAVKPHRKISYMKLG